MRGNKKAARPTQFEQVQVWESNCDLDELIRVNQVWLLKRYNHDADETETVPLSELDAARWLLGHSHPLPKEDTWDGAEADVLHHGLGLWLLVREFQPHPAFEHWEIDVKHLTEPEAFAWLVQNNYHSQQQPASASTTIAGPQSQPPAVRSAWSQYQNVIQARPDLGERGTDRDAYDFLKQTLTDEGKDVRLPTFLTWQRYLRSARRALGRPKHTPRHGRSHGSSIVRQDQI